MAERCRQVRERQCGRTGDGLPRHHGIDGQSSAGAGRSGNRLDKAFREGRDVPPLDAETGRARMTAIGKQEMRLALDGTQDIHRLAAPGRAAGGIAARIEGNYHHGSLVAIRVVARGNTNQANMPGIATEHQRRVFRVRISQDGLELYFQILLHASSRRIQFGQFDGEVVRYPLVGREQEIDAEPRVTNPPRGIERGHEVKGKVLVSRGWPGPRLQRGK